MSATAHSGQPVSNPAPKQYPYAAVYDDILQTLQRAKTVFLTAHVSPDGDTLGAMLGFYHAIKKHCPHLEVIHPAVSGVVADIYYFMPGRNDMIDTATERDRLLDTYDVSIAFDCGAVDRLACSKPLFLTAMTSINIDHHVTNACYGNINLVDAEASASGQVVADFLNYAGIAYDANIAPNLYCAILTDTGGFKYSNATPEVFRMCADLIAAGADPVITYKKVYDETPVEQLSLQTHVLQNIQFNADKTVGWVTVSQSMIKSFGAKEEHLEGLIERIRSINTVKVCAVLKESIDGSTKVSARSDDERISVADIMMRFEGGGHKMAAGCTIYQPLDMAAEAVVPLLEAAVFYVS